MIDGLINGKLTATPVVKTSANGSEFILVRLTTTTQSGDNINVNGIAFDEAARNVLEPLEQGDSVTLAGAINPKIWEPEHGEARINIDMIINLAMSAYQAGKKKQF